MAGVGEIGWRELVPWLLTAAGIGVSLAWNFYNYRRTTALQRRIRREIVRLEEFRQLRVPIDATLVEFGTHRVSLANMAYNRIDIAAWRGQLALLEADMTEVYQRLQGSLERASASPFASGDDWPGVAEKPWSEAAAMMNAAHNPNRQDAETRATATAASVKLAEMIAAVERRIDREVERYLRD